MGKLTYKRVIVVPARNKIVGSFPVIGGVLFLVGSVFFWPDLLDPNIEQAETYTGAVCFLLGSVFYLLQPLNDYYDLTWNIANLADQSEAKTVTWWDWWDERPRGKGAPDYEFLYKAQMLRIQGDNALIYVVGSLCFVGGSVFFLPPFAAQIVHGGWLYIVGCVLVLFGAAVAYTTAREMKKTSKRVQYGDGWTQLPWLSDEGATMASCSLYIVGNTLYIIGCFLFFPGIIRELGGDASYAAVILFIAGSVFFTLGAVVDYMVLIRDGQTVEEVHEKTTLVKHSG